MRSSSTTCYPTAAEYRLPPPQERNWEGGKNRLVKESRLSDLRRVEAAVKAPRSGVHPARCETRNLGKPGKREAGPDSTSPGRGAWWHSAQYSSSTGTKIGGPQLTPFLCHVWYRSGCRLDQQRVPLIRWYRQIGTPRPHLHVSVYQVHRSRASSPVKRPNRPDQRLAKSRY